MLVVVESISLKNGINIDYAGTDYLASLVDYLKRVIYIVKVRYSVLMQKFIYSYRPELLFLLGMRENYKIVYRIQLKFTVSERCLPSSFWFLYSGLIAAPLRGRQTLRTDTAF